MKVQHFFDRRTSTLTYLVFDEAERVGVVIDPVLDYEPSSGTTWTESADIVAEFVERERLRIPYVLDTHAHADHMTAIPYFKKRFGAQSAIGAGITSVQTIFRDLFNLGADLPTDGSQFDILLEDGDTLEVGPFSVKAIHTPGHTRACLSYLIGNMLFVGDTLFQPDYGTARCDFPGGSADDLFSSIQALYTSLPPETRTFTCHDYQPGGRDVAFESTLQEHRDANVQLDERTLREDFVSFRHERDATLGMPQLILPAIQINIRAGLLPEPESNGTVYVKLPLNAFGEKA